MSHADHSHIGCRVKELPEEHRIEAANVAIRHNPVNAPPPGVSALAAPGESFGPAELALMTSKYWGAGGVHLSVSFLDSPPADLRKRILGHMNAWGRWCNVVFSPTAGEGQVRIARQGGDEGGYWSYVGTDVLSIGAGQPTMNLEAFTMNTPESEFHRVVRHETGHTLGFPHEHLRQTVINRIDKAKAIAYFKQSNGWDAAMTTSNVLTPIPDSALMASAATDVKSIMCYWLPGTIMKDGVAVPGGPDVDAQDAKYASTLYPKSYSNATAIWPNGKAYFFRGSQYVRYDPVLNKADSGFPKPIAGNWPGLPASFAAGVDAVVLWGNGKAYFFKADKYVRYDVAANQADAGYPKPIAGNWTGLEGHTINAAIRWPNGKAYFFRGSTYVRYDIAAGKVDGGFPRPIAGNWKGLPASFTAGIEAAVVWDDGKVYFFKDAQYVRYDIAANTADAGFPKPIAGNWPGLFSADVDA
jgi:hypothetical protein